MRYRRVRYLPNCLAGVILSCSATLLAKPIVVTGGLSPNGKLAVVVKRDEDTSQDSISADNEHPSLEDITTGKIIGPLEEVDTMGGGFGHVLANLSVYWNSESDYLAITYRAGRLDYATVIYRIQPYRNSWRAMSQTLPADSTGPNGKAIFAHPFIRANGGILFEEWLGRSKVALTEYGKELTSEAAGRYFGDDGIGIIYSTNGSSWKIDGYRKPPTGPFKAGKVGSSGGRVSAELKYLGAPQEVYSLTVRDYKGNLLLQDDDVKSGPLESIEQTGDGQCIVVMIGQDEGCTAWAYPAKGKTLQRLGDFGRSSIFAIGAQSMKFYSLNPPNISNPEAPENWITINVAEKLKSLP